MDPSVEDVGGGAAWRTGIVGEAGTGGVESYFEAKCDFLPQ